MISLTSAASRNLSDLRRLSHKLRHPLGLSICPHFRINFLPPLEERTATFVIMWAAIFTAAILVLSVIKYILTYLSRWLESKFAWLVELEALPINTWTDIQRASIRT